MNSRQLQYAIQLSETRSFSHLADKLNISQPALSKHIQSLENELGIKLFDRNTVPLTLTTAGTYFIQEAKKLLYKEEQLLRTLDLFKTGEVGTLVIGVSPFRCLYLLPKILKKVKERYPGIQIILHETNSDQLRKEATEGKYDFAIINLPIDDSVLEVTPLETDNLVLAIPNELIHYIIPDHSNIPAEIEFKVCKNIPFIVLSPAQEMRKLFDKLCTSADFSPHISAEVVGVTTAKALACAGLGATLLPEQFVKHDPAANSLTLFSLKDNIYTRQPVIVTRRGQYISDQAKYAIQLLLESTE